MARPVEYLRWHAAHSGGRHDLATSDQRAVAGDPGVVPSVLADRSDPPAGTSLAAQLATVYGVDPDQVLVTAGASHANFVAFATALADGSVPGAAPTEDGGPPADPDASDTAHGFDGRALVELPGYEPLVATPEWLGATADRFRRPAAADYALEADRIAAALRDDTDLVVVTNRHNPSGRRVDRPALATAAGAARDHGARLLVDEVYAPFGLAATDGPFGGPTAAGLEGTVVTSSLTKFFGLGDLTVGWLIADSAFVARARAVLHHVPCVSAVARAQARRALHHREALAERARDLLATNYDLLASFVAERPALSGPVYEGSTYAFLQHGPADDPTDGDRLVEAAAAADCTVVPGRFFDAPDRIRVSLGHDPAAMTDALAALGTALDDL